MNREILRLALPSIVQNVTVPLLGLADMTIIGHVGGSKMIGAIAVGSMIFNVIYWLFGFLRMGTGGLTAQAYGAQRMDEAMAVLRQGLTVALAIAAAIVVLQWPLRLVALWLMGPEAEVAALVTPYYNVCVWGAPAVLSLYVMNGWMIGMQDTRTPMKIAVTQNVANIALSALFVFALRMGVAGAALGTVIAQWIGVAYAARETWSRSLWSSHTTCGVKRQAAKFFKGRLTPHVVWLLHSSFFRINRDIFLRTVCLVAVNLWFTAAGARQGAVVLAVNALLMQLFTLFSYVMDGFAYAGEALAGRYYGAGDRVSLLATVRRLFVWGWAVAAVFTLVYWAGGSAFLGLLTSDGEVVAASAAYQPWTLLIPLCGMAAFVWDGIFIGTTLSRGMLVSCAWATAAFFLLWLALRPLMGNHALWLALLVYLALRGVLQSLIFKLSNCSA